MHEINSSIQAVRIVLQDAHNSQLIKPTSVENLAAKRCVNVANTILKNIEIADSVITRDIMDVMHMCESTARNYLKILHELGYLEKHRVGKGFVYKYKYTKDKF